MQHSAMAYVLIKFSGSLAITNQKEELVIWTKQLNKQNISRYKQPVRPITQNVADKKEVILVIL